MSKRTRQYRMSVGGVELSLTTMPCPAGLAPVAHDDALLDVLQAELADVKCDTLPAQQLAQLRNRLRMALELDVTADDETIITAAGHDHFNVRGGQW